MTALEQLREQIAEMSESQQSLIMSCYADIKKIVHEHDVYGQYALALLGAEIAEED